MQKRATSTKKTNNNTNIHRKQQRTEDVRIYTNKIFKTTHFDQPYIYQDLKYYNSNGKTASIIKK